jgi:hypothetical protein
MTLKPCSYATALTLYRKYIDRTGKPANHAGDSWFIDWAGQHKLAVVRESAAGAFTAFALRESEAA